MQGSGPDWDIDQLVDEGRVGTFQAGIVLVCSLVALLDGFDLQAMAFLTPTLAQSWHLPPADFRLVLSASLVGLALGALAAGPLSDRFGRRRILRFALVVLAASSLGCATAGDLDTLFAWRLVTGMGLGASLPNVIALVAEYAPARNRALLLCLMMCGLPLGGALGSQLAAKLIAGFGWKWVFLSAAAMPLVILGALAGLVPESIKYLAARGGKSRELRRVLGRLRPDLKLPQELNVRAPQGAPRRSPVTGLFRDGRAAGTLLLWMILFLNLFAMYYLSSWLPTVLQNAGWSSAAALRGTAAFHYGGLAGGLFLSFLLDHLGAYRVLPAAYVFTALVVRTLGAYAGHPAITLWGLALCGAGIIGAQFCLNALVAAWYPTPMRATGVGWGLGMGRVGAILSPLLGGMLIAAHWSIGPFSGVAGAALLVCGLCVAGLGRLAVARV